MLTCEAVLAHYDSTKAMKLACNCNAFANDLGAVLSHTLDDGEHPVASIYLPHVNKSSYSQIEKEALELVYGVKNFTSTCMADVSP